MSGSFSISLPDGRVQTTSYKADHYEGFTAQVEYQGAAAYPHLTTGYKTDNHRPYHSPAQYSGKDRLVLSRTPSPYVSSNPYKSSLVFSSSEEQQKENTEEEVKERKRIY